MKTADINRLFKASELLERAAKKIVKVYANTDSIIIAYKLGDILGDVQDKAAVLFNEALDEYNDLPKIIKKNYDKKYKSLWKQVSVGVNNNEEKEGFTIIKEK